MITSFQTTSTGITAQITDPELHIFTQLIQRLSQLDTNSSAADLPPGTAHLLAKRLRPAPAAAGQPFAVELQELLEPGIREAKMRQLELLHQQFLTAADTGNICISPTEVDDWLAGITQLRLYLSALLHIDSDETATAVAEFVSNTIDQLENNLPARPQPRWPFEVAFTYEICGWWQMSFLQALSKRK